MDRPVVSVVMACKNDGLRLRETIASIQRQTLKNWELIVINDGSTDGTRTILEEISLSDRRITSIHQASNGLTASLKFGCNTSGSTFVARHDVGDLSLPNRFEIQYRYLVENPKVVAVGCSVSWIGPEDEYLGEWVRHQTPEETTRDLIDNSVGFVHPSVMFRRDAYEKAGGYRHQFRLAQDHDLWYRMAEQGLLATCPEVLFEYRMDLAGISSQNRRRQQRLGQLARECFLARKRGESEGALLEEATRVSWETSSETSSNGRQGVGDSAYFIGSQLYRQRDQRCRRYFRMAIAARAKPFSSAVKYATSFMTCCDKEVRQ